MIPDVKHGVYDKDLANLQSVVKTEEKKLADLVHDQADMEKKFKKLQSDPEYNKKALERQNAEVLKAKSSLSQLISKEP